MSIPATRTEPQAAKHGNRRHAASIARQRQQIANPALEMAQSMKRWLDNANRPGGCALPEAKHYANLTDDAWAEFVEMLDDHEMALVNQAVTVEDKLRRQVTIRYEKITATWDDAISAA